MVTTLKALVKKSPWLYNALRRLKQRASGVPGIPAPPVPGTPEAAELLRAIQQVTWFHTMDLGQGIVTVGRDPTPQKLGVLGIPDDLTGRTVLDIGAWDGFFSFEAERRGAARVLATDKFSWGHGGWGSKAGFELARRVLRSKVEDTTIDVMELGPEVVGQFDVVFFFGVLYHMRHPLLSLEKVASVTRGMLILETHVDMLDCSRPAMAFYPGKELSNDPTNWCGPNPQMVIAMLETVGFRTVKVQAGPHYSFCPTTRMVFHAWK